MRPIAGPILAVVLMFSSSAALAAASCEEDKPTSQNNWSDSQRTAQPDPRFKRKEVAYKTAEAPGTIVIETHKTYLYLVLGNGKALRYGIGVGREGFKWTGSQHITRKAAWPDWHPPKEMLKRDPCLPDMIPGGRTIRLGAGPCISAIPSSASMARSIRQPSGIRYRRAASGSPTTTSSISIIG